MDKGFMYYLDLAIKKWFQEVWQAMNMIDYEPIKEIAFKYAFNKHVELLKKNMPDALYGERVESLDLIQQRYMKGMNLLIASALAKVFETIKEGEEVEFANLRIRMIEGEIKIEKMR